MSKKEYLELLIKSYGLTPKDVRCYHTDSCGGQFESGIGWEGSGVDDEGIAIIRFVCPDGFNMAVHEILEDAYNEGLKPIYISN